MTGTLYLPVETAARELDAKLLLALHVADRGMPVVLGNRALLSNSLHKHSPGVFLSHNFDRGRRRMIGIARDLGHVVLGQDEEGLVFLSPEVYRHRRADADAISLLDGVITWGGEHTAAIQPLTGEAGVPVLELGNPRADLLRPELRSLHEPRAQALRAELGRFILINSNFGWLNYALANGASHDDENIAELARRSRHPEPFLRFRLEVFRAFVAALPALSKADPDRTVVIRPHPSEDRRSWDEAASGLDNVLVRYDDELVPWLLAAETVVHNGCTTGIEAALLGRTSVMYRPVDGGAHEISQPLSVSREARTVDALIDAVAAGPSPADDVLAALDRLVAPGLSAPRIADAIVARARDVASRAPSVRGRMKGLARSLEKSVASLSGRSPANPAYVAQKFPKMGAAVVAERLGRFAALLAVETPKVSELSDRIFRIVPSH